MHTELPHWCSIHKNVVVGFLYSLFLEQHSGLNVAVSAVFGKTDVGICDLVSMINMIFASVFTMFMRVRNCMRLEQRGE